jgi:sn-glycerol 3-phosphate transport system permease protein
VAPAVAGVLWLFMFQPSLGMIARGIRALGIDWNPLLNGTHAMILVVIAATWKQISYNFLFFLAGPAVDPEERDRGRGHRRRAATRRFWTIVFPLLSPTTFFLLVVNIVYAFFDTFGIIDATTGGGPPRRPRRWSTRSIQDGFARRRSRRLGRAVGDPDGDRHRAHRIQFRYIERKVHY